MPGLDLASEPDPLTTVALLGLAVVLWVYARVHVLRGQQRRGAQGPGVTRLRFLHRLAAWGGTSALLGLLALGLVALLLWSAL